MSSPPEKKIKRSASELEKLLAAKTLEYTRLENDNTRLENDNTRLEKDKTRLENDKTRLENDKTILNERINQVESDKTRLENDNTRLNERIDQVESERDAVSLFAVASEKHDIKIPNLQNEGTPSSHNYPKHGLATAEEQFFPLQEVSKLSPDVWSDIEDWMKKTPSFVLTRFVKRTKVWSFETEADVQFLTQLALEDSTSICEKIILAHAEKSGTLVDKIPQLVTRKERSIFSNYVDHTVVFDLRSQLPIFSIEVKKFFNDTITNGTENRVYGQSHDQLRAMKAKGHSTPFAAICSFQETFITWLDNDRYNDVLDSHASNSTDRLQRITKYLPNVIAVPSRLTQSPPQAQSPPQVTPSVSLIEQRFDKDPRRHIVRSEQCFESKQLVCLFTNVLFCALDAIFTPRPFLDFKYDKNIDVDVIQMKEKSYEWGKLKTKMIGPFTCQQGKSKQDLFLVDYIGSGSTSVVYRALTMNGCDSVVKMLVGVHSDDVKSHEYVKKQETDEEFRSRSKKKVEFEVNAYSVIYGQELDGYVWMQTLNNLDCVVMPFFRPIEKDQRRSVLSKVQKRLEQFQSAKMVFTESDQLWRHVGSFQDKIFLFDLGDLKFIDDECQVKEEIKKHFSRLEEKIGTNDIATTPTREQET